MSDPSKDDPHDADRTVFIPSGSGAPSATPAPPQPPATGWGSTPDVPAALGSAPPAPSPQLTSSPATYQSEGATAWSQAHAASGQEGAPGLIGATLNNIYQVRRFLARGGMGEVYEGVNVITDERVAIKVILQHLAADPNVQAMFRREARTLTRLSHPALVQYRLLAQEPQLGIFYIVTEFIDGVSLADVLGKIHPSADQLRSLTRRLAEGLRAAHELEIFHRDMSPDNVLLPGGVLGSAKVIDFGIAKDGDASTATIVGDGFAGKLNYVAPEQFGDFGREIGPWTDVYSLALVIMALAKGQPVDMGATLVDAIDKRRQGPDLSILPEELRPVFAGMLAPNPKDRLPDMTAVLRALDGQVSTTSSEPSTASAPVPPKNVKPAPEKAKTPANQTSVGTASSKSNLPIFIGGGVAAAIVLGVGGLFASGAFKPPAAPEPSEQSQTASPETASTKRAVDVVEAALPGLDCSWLEVADLQETAGKVSLTVSGASANPAAAVSRLVSALQANGASSVETHSDDVAQLAPAACPALNSFRKFRAPLSQSGQWVKPQQPVFHFQALQECGNDPNQARAVIETAKVAGGSDDFSLIGMESTGGLQTVVANQADFKSLQSQIPMMFQETTDTLQLNLCNDKPVAMGVLMIRGVGPFNTGLATIQQAPMLAGPDFPARFEAMARSKGWNTQMAWYRVADKGT